MCLIPGEPVALPAELGERPRETLEEQIGEGLPDICQQPGPFLGRGVLIEELRQVRREVVAAESGEVPQRCRSPIDSAQFEGVVEQRADPVAVTDRVAEVVQMAPDRAVVEVVRHQALTAGSGSFDPLEDPAVEHTGESPVAGRGGPVQLPVLVHARGQIHGVAGLDLASHERGKVRLGNGRHRRAQVRARQSLLVDQIRMRRMNRFHRLVEPLPAPQLPVFDESTTGAVPHVHPRPAESPAGTGGQVDTQVTLRRRPERGVQSGEPFATQVPADPILVALGFVDGLDLDSAETVARELIEFLAKTVLGDCTAQPPPAGPRSCFAIECGPAERTRPTARSHPLRRLRGQRRTADHRDPRQRSAVDELPAIEHFHPPRR
nr:hypothetical protein [Prauserella sediminis]